jgi:hypothetical protein
MNRRRKAKTFSVALGQIDSMCDIGVDDKFGQIVMIFANVRGRQVVEELWPEVEWATDERFAPVHPPDWLFTHIRVTKLPPQFEEQVPLAFASPELLGRAVAMALQGIAERPRRVAHWTGQGADIGLEFFDYSRNAGWERFARSLFVEHVPAGTVVGVPESVN